VKIEVQLVSPNMNVKTRNVNIDKCLFIVWSFTVAANSLICLPQNLKKCINLSNWVSIVHFLKSIGVYSFSATNIKITFIVCNIFKKYNLGEKVGVK